MVRVLIVSHSPHVRESVLWRGVLENYPLVDLVVPYLRSETLSLEDCEFLQNPRVFQLPAVEPFGKGRYSSMWIKGLLKNTFLEKYDLVHAHFEPWSVIPQMLCGKVPTVVHGVETVIGDAPLALRIRRLGTTRVLKRAAGVLAWGQTSLDAYREVGLPASTPQAIIPSAIPDPLLFTSKPIDPLSGPLRVLFVGRLVPEKGIRTLIDGVFFT